MIEKNVPLNPGTIIQHDEEGGLRYRILGPVLDATGWEKTHKVGDKTISYKQLEDGSFPAGQIWRRDEQDLRNNFSIEDQPED